jgi:predicted acetyltransferase
LGAVSFPVRAATMADFPQIARLTGTAYGEALDPDEYEDALEAVSIERFLIATDPAQDGRVVGTTADYRFAVTVPGGAAVPVPGVTWVAVAVTHRRRGILRALMDRQLRSYLDINAPFVVLTASEGGIYTRFGYGAATAVRDVVVNRAQTRLAEAVDATMVVSATADEARAVLPGLHRRWCAQTPGAVSRGDVWWRHFFADRVSSRGGMSERYFLLHPDGYVALRVRDDARGRHVSIRDDAIVSPDARAALWQVLLAFDLYAGIETARLPLDDPLPLLLTDPRRVETTSTQDGMWVRLLDVGAALAARTYGVDVDAVLEVHDPLVGDGRFRVQGGPGGATCARTDALPDLRIGVAALGSVYLGGHRLDQLARAGRAEAGDPGVLGRLDRAFLADRSPAHGTSF